MTRPEPIHAEHCSCGRCTAPPIRPQSPALAIALVTISVAIVVALLAWASTELREQLLTFQNF